jgi:hypothetical protein
LNRLLALLAAGLDRLRMAVYLRQPDTTNKSTKLQALLQALTDASDSLEAIHSSVVDDDLEEAKRLLLLAHESLQGYIDELRELL